MAKKRENPNSRYWTDPTEQRRREKLRQVNRQNRKQKEEEIRKLQYELGLLYDGEYDKPMAVEMQALYAKTAYILSRNTTEAAMMVKMPVRAVHTWAKEREWELQRKIYYQKVEQMLDKYIGNTAEHRARVIAKVESRILTLLEAAVDDDDLDEVSRAKALETLVKVRDSYIGKEEDKDSTLQIPGLSAKARNILINIQSQVSPEQISAEFDELEAEIVVDDSPP